MENILTTAEDGSKTGSDAGSIDSTQSFNADLFAPRLKSKMSKRMMKAYNIEQFADEQQRSTNVSPGPSAPVVVLEPLNEASQRKELDLIEAVGIGRQVTPKNPPTLSNGIFDSKVLSRQHAELKYENGKILIRDMGSSNGTFVNGNRLSAEGSQSEPFAVKQGDLIEFGIDIMNDDNTAVMYKKISCRLSIKTPGSGQQSPSPTASEYEALIKPSQGVSKDSGLESAVRALQDDIKKEAEKQESLKKLSQTLDEVEEILDKKVPFSVDAASNDQHLKDEIAELTEDIKRLQTEFEAVVNSKKVVETELKAAAEKLRIELHHQERENSKTLERKTIEMESLKLSLDTKTAECQNLIQERESHVSKIAQLSEELKAAINSATAMKSKYENEILNIKQEHVYELQLITAQKNETEKSSQEKDASIKAAESKTEEFISQNQKLKESFEKERGVLEGRVKSLEEEILTLRENLVSAHKETETGSPAKKIRAGEEQNVLRKESRKAASSSFNVAQSIVVAAISFALAFVLQKYLV